jgi:CO/xanthine dehydrogenase Mo-binding subunit
MNGIPPFVDDIPLRNPLFALTIRSPAAKGRLAGVTCPRMPHAYGLIKAADIPGKNRLDTLAVPVLAEAAVSYVGEPVALLVGPDEVKLDEYAALCTVQVEEESPFFSRGSLSPESLIAGRDVRIGGTEQSFAGAKTVIGGTYTTGVQEHWYSEPSGAVAVLSRDKAQGKNPGDTMVIHTATQWPFHVRASVAAVLGLPPEAVVVEPSAIGIHLDGKIWYPSLIACHAALGAFIFKKPVKLVLTREEDFRYSPKRCGAEIQIRTALGDRGQILGTEVQVVTDMGAAGEGPFTDEVLDRACLGALGAYEWDALALRGFALRSNIPPSGPLCGFGLAQGFFAAERHISRIADAQRQDPAEWRKNNGSSKNIALPFGVHHKERIPLEEIIDTAAAMSDYRRKWASYELLRAARRGKKREEHEPLRGIGIAAAYQGSGFLYAGTGKGAYGVELTLEKNGSLEIRTSMVSSDREHVSLWQGIAAEILTIDAGAIRVVENRTDLVPDSGPGSLSRNITVVTKLVERACVAIRGQRFRDPLPITVSRSYHPVKIPNWEGKPFDQNALTHLSWGAAVVEVEIDPVEYTPKIRGAWLGIDGGRILSETRARKSLKFSVIHALGWASREDITYESGKISAEYMTSYGLLPPQDIPPIHIDFIWNDMVNPKGIGELPFNCVPAAYVQAVSQAMDYPFAKIPVTGKDVWDIKKTLEEKEYEP